MRVLKEGHTYELPGFEDPKNTQIIQFIDKAPAPGGTDLEVVSDGTTNEKVLEVLINRLQYLNSKFPCRENALAITKMEEAKMWLEKRTSDRIKRNVEGKHLK